jgi:hypothetical protein
MKLEEEPEMANLQIKGVDEQLYAQIKKLAAAQNRSVSQQILYLAKEYLGRRKTIQASRTPTRVLLGLRSPFFPLPISFLSTPWMVAP